MEGAEQDRHRGVNRDRVGVVCLQAPKDFLDSPYITRCFLLP